MPDASAPVTRLTVVVTTSISHRDMHRLCPHGRLSWGRCDFLFNPPRGTCCDFWIVFAGGRDRDHMQCAPVNTLFIAGEPPSKKIYPRAYYGQFHQVVSTRAEDPHPRVTASAPGLNWYVGLHAGENRYVYGYDELKALTPGPKQNKVSVVCSNLTTKEGQRQRLRFLQSLKDSLGETIVHFGRGFTPIDDKMDAIRPYRFHLVLENSTSPHYWTEKLADAYLGFAHPLYCGCPDLADYFPPQSFTALDVHRPEEAVRLIRKKLEAPPTPDEAALQVVCRDLILDTYNPFARFAAWAERFYQPGHTARVIKATTHKAFRPFPRGLLYRLRSRLSPPA